MLQEAVPWFRRLVAGLSSWRSAFDPSPVHVGLVKDEVTVATPPPTRTSNSPCQYHGTSDPRPFLSQSSLTDTFKQNCGRFDV